MDAIINRLKDLEISLLSQNYGVEAPYDGLTNEDPVRLFCRGQYDGVLRSHIGQHILQSRCDEGPHQLGARIVKNVEKFLSIPTSNDEDSRIRELDVLVLAASCLQLFVQSNWLGPPPNHDLTSVTLPLDLQSQEQVKKVQEEIESELSLDGEPVYSLAVHLEYLYYARCILLDCREKLKNLQTANWWLLRCIGVHQCLLDNKSPTLKETVAELIDILQKKVPLMMDDNNRDLIIQFYLEAAFLSYMFYDYRNAKDNINKARKMTGLVVELTGAMGKRTLFQQESKAQLILNVSREGTGHPVSTETLIAQIPEYLPKVLRLDDDTVMNSISFEDKSLEHVPSLSAAEQAVILASMEEHIHNHVASEDNLLREEVEAYLSCVLPQAKCWSICVAALYRRSCMEVDSKRHVERAMMQVEELLNQIKREKPESSHRLDLFYAVKIPPKWIIQKTLADLLLSLGAVGSALEVFEQLQLWEDVIKCCQRLGKSEKAESLIREQLKVKETANMWCYLGDVTNRIENYEKAWEVSGQRSARAQRCMGYAFFRQENYEKAMECFEQSLKINSLQVPLWFTFGCTALSAKKYEVAVKAFSRCVSLDYDNFEAWNNLASAFVKLKDKQKAFLVMKDALKCSYDNWRVWENYLVISTDCGEFGEVIQAYHRLIDLKDKWLDLEVLSILVLAITNNINDAQGNPSSRYRQKVQELFGRITAKVSNSGPLWRLYAQLYSPIAAEKPENQKKMLQYLQKSHRCVIQEANWEKDIAKCKEIADQSVELAETYIRCCDTGTIGNQALQLLSSAKLMLKGILSKIQITHKEVITQELPQELRTTVVKLDSALTKLLEKIQLLKEPV
ncbi:hypothetical protein CHS0354_014583 [Potamilus streckersoni]|uniref:Tetratricopeptide repeat protein 27 n=1 Tax=Potamilus streckersoni TaxID=2493646 RepID=A0AAE0RNR8_9BIVA|nr:hypothetical protein CHS0354_014583 [Potamilus streckersoni]